MPDCVHLASDLHLGASGDLPSVERERAFVRWMRDAASGSGFAEGRKRPNPLGGRPVRFLV